MRVIAGNYRSRPLASAPGPDVRPTSDRLRETLFNVLTAGNPRSLEGSTWIDLYAGTGAVGIEAISRGCGVVYFMDSSQRAIDLIVRNLASLNIDTGVEVLRQEAITGLQAMARRKIEADFVFLDPPYKLEEEYYDVLSALSQSTMLRHASVVVAEHGKRFDPGNNFENLTRYRALQQGEAALSFYRLRD